MKEITWNKIIAEALVTITLSPLYYVTALLWLAVLPAPIAIVVTFIIADVFNTIWYQKKAQNDG